MGATGATGAQGVSGTSGAHQGRIRGRNVAPDPEATLNHTTLRRPDFKPEDSILYPSGFKIRSTESQMHVRAWAASEQGKSTPDFCISYVVARNGHPNIALHFGSKESADRFQAWLARYRALFTHADLSTHLFPDIPNGTLALTYVECPDFGTTDAMPVAILAWISENCTRPFYFTQGKLAFGDPNEAFAFQMRFRGATVTDKNIEV